MNLVNLPNFHQIAIPVSSIENVTSFYELIDLFNLEIFKKERDYYILDGSDIDLAEFREYWDSK